MKTVFRLAMMSALVLMGSHANAATVVGTVLDNTQWSLIHGGSSPSATLPADDHLRWMPNQEIVFDLTGTTLSASGPQSFMLVSDNFDFATFTMQSFSADLDNADGFASGSMDYELSVTSGPLMGDYTGTFEFNAMSVGVFNSSTIDNGVFEMYLWGGDTSNDIGIDIGMSAVVPVPAPLLLLLPSLFGLGLFRRRKL